jgi:twitching motility protein PilT
VVAGGDHSAPARGEGAAALVESLGKIPTEWKANLPDVGPVEGAAVLGDQDVIMVRFVLGKRAGPADGAARAPADKAAHGGARSTRRACAHIRQVASPCADAPSAGVPRSARHAPPAPPSPASIHLESKSLSTLLEGALEVKASDLHIVAERPPLVRLAGALLPAGDHLSAERVEALIMPIVPTRLHAELTKDGAVDFAYQHPVLGRFRVNVNHQRTGLKACFRMIPAEVPTLESLGLPHEIAKATHHHQGLIVIAGPTGHGKTSTLAALVNLINSETTHHVITVEDPVEYVHPRKRAMMSQREVGAHTRSFQAALKGSLREDPDVIVIGELRDTETVRIALTASETGHLVIGTMNTQSAAKTIDRLIDLFPPSDQQQVRMTLAGGLRLIVSQRLVPRADGRGMAVAAELLPGLIPLWNLIREHKTYQIPSLQQRGKSLGIIRLDDSLAELVKRGTIRMEDAAMVADSAEELQAIVSGKPRGVVSSPDDPKTPEPKTPTTQMHARTPANAARSAAGTAGTPGAAQPPPDRERRRDKLAGRVKSIMGGILGRDDDGEEE